MEKQKILQSLGLASKAQSLIWGTKLFEQIKLQKVLLVILGVDMGASQKKKLINQCQYYNVEIWDNLFNCQEISQACGKTKIVAVGITDLNFFKLIKKYN